MEPSLISLKRKRLQLVILDDDDELMLDDFIFSSDDENEENDSGAGGSQPGKKPNINRKRALYGKLLQQDYFSDNPTYSAQHFRRRFCSELGKMVRVYQKTRSKVVL